MFNSTIKNPKSFITKEDIHRCFSASHPKSRKLQDYSFMIVVQGIKIVYQIVEVKHLKVMNQKVINL